MPDHRNKLQALFEPAHRYANFGAVLTRMHVQGFRCHESTLIEVESPITAFCGLNGTGKSTLLQLAACSYRCPPNHGTRYYIRDFIVAGTLDPDPFSKTAVAEYGYWEQDRTIRNLKVTRSASESRWRGYKAQPERPCYFAGMGLYLPRIEVRDFVVRNAASVTVEQATPLDLAARTKATRILSCTYDAMVDNTVRHGRRQGHVVTVERGGKQYSEANMGCGEGRVQHLIRRLSTLPERSLVLLEEPETSLHPSAQHEFGRYLIDVCIDRKLQVLLTTHSEYLLRSLPSASRVYVDRGPAGLIRVIKGVTTAQAMSMMTGGKDKALHVLVEDHVAVSTLTEIVRRGDPGFLHAIAVHPAGDSRAIQSAMSALRETGLPVVAVRDGDMPSQPRENIFKLPGALPPERELLQSGAVQEYLQSNYGIDMGEFVAAIAELDHHEWFDRLAKRVVASEPALVQEAARVYAQSLPESEVDLITKQLQESIRK